MLDPLATFDWETLYSRYDSMCKGFKPASVHLSAFQPNPPNTDRTLYYQLLHSFSKSRESVDPVPLYQAMLYWKLYSQGTHDSNITKWVRDEDAVRGRLIALFGSLPIRVGKNVSDVVNAVKMIGKFKLDGMGGSGGCPLPVRTTLLHFVYPNVVPVFDRMVLQAVGVWDKGANQKIRFLEDYLPFAWDLADRYSPRFVGATQESPLRLIDMALWVNRGKTSSPKKKPAAPKGE